MNLKAFLETASADDATALQEARAYTETRYEPISSGIVTMLLVQNGLYAGMDAVANDDTSPGQNFVKGLIDRLKAGTAFSFDPNDTYGANNIAALTDLATNKLPASETPILAFKDDCIAAAGESVTPFASVTLHDVLIAREATPQKPVTQQDGWVVIETTADVEQHNPRLLADSPRTGKRTRINSFMGVSTAGLYESRVPAEWRNAQLYVDDSYGVI